MQKTFYYCLFMVFLFLMACEKDQTLTNRFDGEWEIEEIIFSRDGKDSVVTEPVGVFYFEKCKLGMGDCPGGYYELHNQDRVNIGYNAVQNPDRLGINIKSVLPEGALGFGNPLAIESFNRKKTFLSGRASTYAEKTHTFYDIRMILRKK
jgi:hypothetical protein